MTDRRSKLTMFTVTLIICASMYAVAATQQMTEEQRAKKAKLAMQEARESARLAQALFAEAHYRAREVTK